MGYGGYSHEAHEAISSARASLPRQQIFTQSQCHPLMNPLGVKFRESRDSPAHPNSLPVIFALDVTGSMGDIPETLAKKELPVFMQSILDLGVADPQVLFMAIGDAKSDKAPLQVGQFESAAAEIDQWLTRSYLESGGGPFGRESYELALYFAARHTDLDSVQKRHHRGYFFMTGDEHPYPSVSRSEVTALIGDTLTQDLPLSTVLRELGESFHPFFLIPDEARRARCERQWRDLMGDHVVCMSSPSDTCLVASALIAITEGADIPTVVTRLKSAQVAPERVGAVVRAVTPYASSLARDGAPAPSLGPAVLPQTNNPSTHRRP